MDKQKLPPSKVEVNLSRPVITEDDKPAAEKDKVPTDKRILSKTKLENGITIEQY